MAVTGSYQSEKTAPLLAGRAVFAAPAAAANNTLKAATNVTTLTQSLTPITQPVVPRNVTLTFVDTTVSITGGTFTVTGIDQNGKSVSEVHTITGAGVSTGSVAFASVVSVVCALTGTFTGAGDETLAIGVGLKHGLPVGIDGKLEEVFKALHNNANEAVGTVDKTYATVIPTSASNADHNQEFWYSYKARISYS